MEQRGTAEADLDARNWTFDSMTKTAIFFSLHTIYMCKNS